MTVTFSVEVEDVLDTLPIDPTVVRSGTGRITVEMIRVWIGEADAILTNLLKMNGAAVTGDDASLDAGRAAIKWYAASNALRKINNFSGATEYMQMWKAERLIFAQKPREIAGAIPLESKIQSNVEVDVCQKKYGRKNFEW